MLKLGISVVNLDLPLTNLISGKCRRLSSAKQAAYLSASIQTSVGRFRNGNPEPFRAQHWCALFLLCKWLVLLLRCRWRVSDKLRRASRCKRFVLSVFRWARKSVLFCKEVWVLAATLKVMWCFDLLVLVRDFGCSALLLHERAQFAYVWVSILLQIVII